MPSNPGFDAIVQRVDLRLTYSPRVDFLASTSFTCILAKFPQRDHAVNARATRPCGEATMANVQPAGPLNNPDDPAGSRFRAGSADPIFWAGIVVGALLTLAGGTVQALHLLGTTTGQLVLCSGLGLIFGAFGLTATINYKGIVVAGVAAVAIVLLLVVDHLVQDDIARLRVDGDIKGAKLELSGDEEYLGVDRGTSYEFVIVGREIRQPRLKLYVSFPQAADTEFSEYIFECIAKSEIEKYLGGNETVQWRFDRKNGLITGPNGKRIAAVGGCVDPGAATTFSFWKGLSPVGSAAAQGSIDSLLRGLNSESSVERRTSRKALAAQGLDAVRPVLDNWAAAPDDYRRKLGAAVALTEYLRDNKADRSAISAKLTLDDLARLVLAAADHDRTVRVYASEFLFDLGDPRVAPLALQALPAASDDGKFNLVLVLKGTLPSLDDAARQTVTDGLSALRPRVGAKTQAKIDELITP